MINPASKFGVLLLLCFSFNAFGQHNANNVLGSYGIGETNLDSHSSYAGMGNTSGAQIDSLNVNFYNPSSYSSIAKGLPVFSVGFDSQLQIFNENGRKEKSSYSQINHFAFGISFAKILGFAFGIRPFSRDNYSIAESQVLSPTVTMRHDLVGTGNTNLFFGGLSVNALNFKHHKLGIGFNAGYLFGSTVNKQLSYIDKGAVINPGTMFQTTHFLKSFYYETGFNYQYLTTNDQFILGVNYRPAQKLAGNFIYEKAYATDLNDFDHYSFVESDQTSGKIYLPQSLTVGFQYRMNVHRSETNSKLNSRLSFAIDYKMSDWSNYREDFGANSVPYDFKNTNTIAFGVEYIPQQRFLDRATTGYMSKVRYRIGGNFASLPYVIDNSQLKRQTFTVGFGFPFLVMRSTTAINFSVSYSNQSAANVPHYNEKFVSFSLGISIAPSINDRWFRKYKIN